MSSDDIMFITITVFSLAFIVFGLYFVMDTLYTGMSAAPVISGNPQALSVFTTQQTRVLPMLDYLVFGVFLALSLGLIITGWFIGGNPIFMVLYVMFAFLVTFISAIFSNAWVMITTQGSWSSYLTHFPITNYLMMHFAMFIGVIGVIGLIVMFAKPFVGGNMQ
jgi:hypothetical protein